MSIYISNFIKKLQDNLEKKVLQGNDIIELTSSKQLNLFILKNIYDAWNKNFEKNKIIYFNYENKEILRDQLDKHFTNTDKIDRIFNDILKWNNG